MKRKCTICLAILLSFLLVGCSAEGKDYKTATELYNAGSYEEALMIFEQISEYKDSGSYIEKCNANIFDMGEKYFERGDFDEAIAIFERFDNDTAQRYISAVKVLTDFKGKWSTDIDADIDYSDYWNDQMAIGSMEVEFGAPYEIIEFDTGNWCIAANVDINAEYYTIKCGYGRSPNESGYKVFTLNETARMLRSKDSINTFIIDNTYGECLYTPTKGSGSTIYITSEQGAIEVTEVPGMGSQSYIDESHYETLTR